ncbi:PepSY-like domain-containing protein [uncultured Alistipes sp.]|uniref:PepSY-like domain-containing protein n=1 Tax=uncultured Alistipes sp. TaxID=538949 RepID=UPI002606F680|nr:PepSY-like domain-containing protein [uncultured Alistipes sp.]
MKKIFVSAALLFAGITASFAGDRERPITLDKLPAAAQEFLAANFKDLTLAYAVEDPKFIGSEYEVVYTDRTEVDFESNGEWSSVERKYEAVPAAIVPVQIADYVKTSFAGQFIRKIDRNKYTWEVELSNGLEIKFDRKFQVVEIDD